MIGNRRISVLKQRHKKSKQAHIAISTELVKSSAALYFTNDAVIGLE